MSSDLFLRGRGIGKIYSGTKHPLATLRHALFSSPEDDPDAYLAQLRPNGEREAVPRSGPGRSEQKPEVTNEHVKVQRLRKTVSWAPWDGLFDLIALWGRAHGIEIVLFQPPVRSDLYRFQLENGLAMHVADLERIAHQYGVPVIDLNRPDLHYMDDWTLFSDEDHLESCVGVVLLHGAIEEGERQFRERGELLPIVTRADVETAYRRQLAQCDARTAEVSP